MSVKGREDSNCYPKGKLESREGPSGRVTQLVNDGAGVRIRTSGFCAGVSSPSISVAALELRFC